MHIFNFVKALLFHSNVPLKLWGGCVEIVVFFMNKTLSLIVNSKSPFEI